MQSIYESINNLSKTNKLILAAFAFLAVLACSGGRAHAASLEVTGGCTLPIAIDSVNAGSNQSGCTAVGGYGTNDTITIPAGTYVIPASLPTITEDVVIEGAGMSQTVIDGDSDSKLFKADDVTIKITDLKITAYREYAIRTEKSDVELSNIEVDGTGAIDASQNLFLNNAASTTSTITANNIYMHDIHSNGPLMYLFSVHQRNGGTTNATLSNISLSDSGNAGGSMDAFALGIGAEGETLGSTGDINATITNATLHNLISTGINAPYASFAFSNGGAANVTVDVFNSTITGSRGLTGDAFPLVGVRSAAFYSAVAGISSGSVGTSTLNVSNSLFADNLTDSTSSNCESMDFTAGFSGAGTGVATINSNGHNISDDATCTTFTQSGDQQNVSNIISTLGPLQDNGGAVPTRALLAGSPAIAAGGSVLGVTTDARGVARPGDCPSVGAFQFEGAVCAATTTNGGMNAAAPNTGIHSVSLLGVAIATLLGFSAIGYSLATKRA